MYERNLQQNVSCLRHELAYFIIVQQWLVSIQLFNHAHEGKIVQQWLVPSQLINHAH